MNVANALAAAAAAWAAGAHLHDIRQGLRTFSTSFFQAPGPAQPARRRRGAGRHRLLPQRRRDAPAGRLRRPDDGASRRPRPGASGPSQRPRQRTGRAIGVIGIPGDRRDEDQREYGAIAATAFDEIIVREDKNLRGRAPGRDRHQRPRGRPAARANGTAPDGASRRSSRRWPRSGRRSAGRPRATSWCAASTTRSAVYREAMAAARSPAGRPRSPTRASSRAPRAEGPGLRLGSCSRRRG